MKKTVRRTKKNPCPDCTFCQWCSDERCRMCRKPCCKDSVKKKKKPHKPLFLKY